MRQRKVFGSTTLFHGLDYFDEARDKVLLDKSTALKSGQEMDNDIIIKCDGIDINQSSSHSLENFLPEISFEQTIQPNCLDDCRFPQLQSILSSPPISYSNQIVNNITFQLSSIGFIDDNELVLFAKDFLSFSSSLSSPQHEMVSHILIHDFGWKALDAHRARVGIVSLVKEHFGYSAQEKLKLEGSRKESFNNPQTEDVNKDNWGQGSLEKMMFGGNQQLRTKPIANKRKSLSKLQPFTSNHELNNESKSPLPEEGATPSVPPQLDSETVKPLSWKSVLVNDRAKIRRRNKDGALYNPSSGKHANGKDAYNYGLLQAGQANGNNANGTSTNDEQIYSNLFAELDSFWEFMTVPQTSSVAEPPIRERTAEVYMRHARLFLGWIVDARGVLLDEDVLKEVVREGEGGINREDNMNIDSSSSPNVGSPSSLAQPSLKTTSAITIRKQIWERARDKLTNYSGRIGDLDGEKYVAMQKEGMKSNISLYDIFPDSRTESTAPILQYVIWMRSQRQISPNYEANILRGLIKLVKFRFASELSTSISSRNNSVNTTGRQSSAVPSTSKKSTPLDDLPIIAELRNIHREAGSKGKKAPRSSDEGKKWLEWTEYLEVIDMLKADLLKMIENYECQLEVALNKSGNDVPDNVQNTPKPVSPNVKSLQKQRKEIAVIFQHYLILAFFSCVPDRQRTFRELELGRNFLRVETTISNERENNGRDDSSSFIWVIKHTADDYKTGGAYGERPPLPLHPSLTPAIDDFLDRWRPALVNEVENPSSPYLFLQPRTGNPMTPNSLYQIVSRCCYKYKQKKTNPHLLRDMIVTHVRKNADYSASEKELEALALFMGHSIRMQRESYDRRTLGQKVEPAIQLMKIVNSF